MEYHPNFLLPYPSTAVRPEASSPVPCFTLSAYCFSLWPPSHTHTFFASSFLQDVWCGRPTLRKKEVDSLFWRSHSHYFLRCTECLWPGAGWGWGDGKEKSPSAVCLHLHGWYNLTTYVNRIHGLFSVWGSLDCMASEGIEPVPSLFYYSLITVSFNDPLTVEPKECNYVIKANFSSDSNNLTPISSYECKASAQEETQWRSSLRWFFLTFENVKQHLPLVAARSCALVKTINRDHLFFSAEPNAWEHEAVWLHLQQQMVHWDLHHPLPQQEGSLWGEDYSQPAHHLLPRVHRYTNVCLHPRAALSSRRVLSNHNIRKLNLSS